MDEDTAAAVETAAAETAAETAAGAAQLDLVHRVLDLVGLAEHAADPGVRALVIFGLALLVAAFLDIVARRVLANLAERTAFQADDVAVQYLRRPIAITVVLVGAWWALAPLPLGDGPRHVAKGILATAGVVTWVGGLMKVGHYLLEALAARAEAPGTESRLVRPRTLPLFDMAVRAVVLGGGAYGLLLAWNVDVTAWLASAGVLGIAVGFAAQETLSNLLAGVVIIGDAPYKLGDFLVLDSGQRGRVTDIGLRSTRMLTQDGVEIVVPNSVMVKATITNESGGGTERERLSVNAGVAYGSDVEHVREVLLEEARQCPGVINDDPGVAPAVQFRNMGESSLDFVVLVWIHTPEARWAVVDRLTTRIYKRLTAEGIGIPFPQRDVYLYDMGPKGDGDQGGTG